MLNQSAFTFRIGTVAFRITGKRIPRRYIVFNYTGRTVAQNFNPRNVIYTFTGIQIRQQLIGVQHFHFNKPISLGSRRFRHDFKIILVIIRSVTHADPDLDLTRRIRYIQKRRIVQVYVKTEIILHIRISRITVFGKPEKLDGTVFIIRIIVNVKRNAVYCTAFEVVKHIRFIELEARFGGICNSAAAHAIYQYCRDNKYYRRNNYFLRHIFFLAFTAFLVSTKYATLRPVRFPSSS